MQHPTVSFGIIGCGTIAEWHARAVEAIEGARLVGVADNSRPACAAFAARHHVRAFAGAEDLLSSPDIDAVCICTPSGLHAPLAIQAARHGKHVVVEKPMAITAAQLNDVTEACRAHSVKLAVISQLRFSPAVRQLKAAIGRGDLGRLVTAGLSMQYYRSQEYYDRGGWRGTWQMDGGGTLMNQGIHGVDLLLYAMGPVRSVFAVTRTLARRIEVEDTAVATVEFQNGAVGCITASTAVYPGSPRVLEICGDRGTIRLEEDAIAQWETAGQSPPPEVHIGGSAARTARSPTAFGVEGHIRQLSDMAEAIRQDRAPVVGPAEGRRAVDLILAVYESSRTGKPVCFPQPGTAGR